MRTGDLRTWLRDHAALATVVVAAILLAVTVGPHLSGEFLWDDIPLVRDNPALASLRLVFGHDLWGGATGRPTQLYHPLPMATLWLQARLGAQSVAAFRAGNVVLHLAAVGALVVWLRARGANAAAVALAGLLFALHPSVTEPVMWLTGRHDLVGVALILWALVVQARLGAGFLAGALAALAFFSKEPFVIAPLLLVLDEALLGARRWLRLLPAFGWLGVAIAVRHLLGISVGSDAASASLGQQLRHYAGIVAHYAVQLVTLGNAPTIVTYRAPAWLTVAAVYFAIAGVVTLLAVYARRPLVGVLWFLIALAPYVLALPILGIWGNRYAYLPLAGLCAALAFAVDPILARVAAPLRKWLAIPAAAVVLVAAVGLRAEALPWRDGLALFGAGLEQVPTDARAIYHYANEVQVRAGCGDAMPYFEQAVRADPGYWDAWHNLAGCSLNLHRFHDARAAAERAVALRPGNARSRYNLGVALLGLGRVGDGVAQLQQAVALDPEYVPARQLLAQAVSH